MVVFRDKSTATEVGEMAARALLAAYNSLENPEQQDWMMYLHRLYGLCERCELLCIFEFSPHHKGYYVCINGIFSAKQESLAQAIKCGLELALAILEEVNEA